MKSLNYKCLLAFLFIAYTGNVSAKVWRVNSTAGISADFTQITAAVASASVQTDDTIYVESSASTYLGITLTKRLVFIGGGYLLNENTGLQASPNASTVEYFILDSLASGSSFNGLRIVQFFANSNADNISISRCNVALIANNLFANSKMSGWNVNKCLITSLNFSNSNYVFENLQLINNICSSTFIISSGINGLIRNNLFSNGVTISNCYVTNNLFIGFTSLAFTNCTVKYNIAQINVLPAGNNNQNNVSQASLFLLTGSSDGRYRLAPGSPAIAAGEPISGETPDCGPFGTADPYRLSGIPAIPSIYQLTVPAAIPSSSTSMTITVSTRSNN